MQMCVTPRWICSRSLVVLSLATVLCGARALARDESQVGAQGGHDWIVSSGPAKNHTSPETGLVDTWNPKGGPGSNLLWKNEKLATRSTPIVMNGRIYVICRADEGMPTAGEKVVCADAATGKIIWENKFNVYLSDVPAERIGWSSCTGDPETGNIYALGVCGYFQ